MEEDRDTAVDVFTDAHDRAPSVHPAPVRIGRYHVVTPIGRGGMAEVYLAELRGPRGFRRQVAIKRLHPALAHDADMVERFVHEATIASRLIHPTICQVYELDEDDSGCFMVMEYLDGVTLSAVLKELARTRWLLPVPIVLRVMRALCAGLHAAHELRGDDGRPYGLIHRDVSPSNIVLTATGQVKLLDFGVAKTDHIHTQIGVVRGKPGYMSPEQIARRPLDRRCDVFALGIVLFEALTSKRLFARSSMAAANRAVTDEPLPDPRAHRPDLSPAQVAVITRALARDPDDRYPTAAALLGHLLDAAAPATTAPGSWLARLVAAIRSGEVDVTSPWTPLSVATPAATPT